MATKQWKKEHIDEMRRYRREWYARNRKHAKSKVIERKDKIKEWYYGYKLTLSCTRCPENHPATLHFHHVDSDEKDMTIAHAATNNGWSIDRIKKEMSKCIVLCANCHAKEHFNQRMHPSSNG